MDQQSFREINKVLPLRFSVFFTLKQNMANRKIGHQDTLINSKLSTFFIIT